MNIFTKLILKYFHKYLIINKLYYKNTSFFDTDLYNNLTNIINKVILKIS